MLKWRWQKWWYWKRFGPKYCISPVGKVRVEKKISENGKETQYRIFFQFKLQCQNRDNLNKVSIDCDYSSQRMYFELKAKNVHMRTKPYFLIYKEGDIRWSIPPNEEDERIYLIEGNYDVIPVLGETVRCKVIHLAYARVENIGRFMNIYPFDIEVEKFKLANKEISK